MYKRQFKKGLVFLPDNYRPISLLHTFAKLYDQILLSRLQILCDSRISHSHSGYRAERGVSNCLHVIRRLLDLTHGMDAVALDILLLDWVQAFDRTHPGGIRHVLQRFGITGTLYDVVCQRVQTNNFQVVGGGQKVLRGSNSGAVYHRAEHLAHMSSFLLCT